MAAKYKRTQAFTVPAGLGSYAPERLTIGVPPDATVEESLLGCTLLLMASSPANCEAEIWLAKLGATGLDADYANTGFSVKTAGAGTLALASWPGFQIRVKSGGTAGTATVHATAD